MSRPEFITWQDDKGTWRALNTHMIESMHQRENDVHVYVTADAPESHYQIPNTTVEELIKRIKQARDGEIRVTLEAGI